MSKHSGEGEARDITREFVESFGGGEVAEVLKSNPMAALQFVVRGDEFQFFVKNFDELIKVAEQTIMDAAESGNQAILMQLSMRQPSDLKLIDGDKAIEMTNESAGILGEIEQMAAQNPNILLELAATNPRIAKIYLSNEKELGLQGDLARKLQVVSRAAANKLPD